MKKLLSYISFGKEARGTRSASVYACFFVLIAASLFLVPHEVRAAGLLETVGGFFTGAANATVGGALSLVTYFILMLSTGILALAGMAFNWVMFVTVFQFSAYFGNSEGLLAAWTILRDIGNIALLFGFVYIGIQTILNIDHHFSVASALPRLLIVAVLMNFSLFISQGIIDVSNALGTAIYNQAGSEPGTCLAENNAPGSVEYRECAVNYGISGRVMRGTGLGSLFSPDNQINFFDIKTAVLFLMASLFATVTAVVLVAAAIMFLIRGIVLTFVMVMSPLAFAAMALPPFSEKAQGWWDKLFSQSFFAPAFLLLVMVSLKIAEGFSFDGGNGVPSLMQGLASRNASMMGVIFIYLIVIGFMIYSLILAKNFGAFGASFATKTAGKWVVGSQSKVLRGTLGRGLTNISKKAESDEFKQKHPRVAMTLRNPLVKYGANASYDLRGGAVGGAIKDATHLDFGKPPKSASKKGYMGDVEDQAKKYAEAAKSLTLTKEQTQLLEQIRDQIKEQNRTHQEEVAKINTEYDEKRREIDQNVSAARDRVAAAKTPVQKRDAEQALANAQEERRFSEQERSKKLQAAVSVHDERVTTLQKKEKEAENAAKEEYASRLENRRVPFVNNADMAKKAAGMIRDDYKKSKSQKDLEGKLADIKSALEKAEHEEKGGDDKKKGGAKPAH